MTVTLPCPETADLVRKPPKALAPLHAACAESLIAKTIDGWWFDKSGTVWIQGRGETHAVSFTPAEAAELVGGVVKPPTPMAKLKAENAALRERIQQLEEMLK